MAQLIKLQDYVSRYEGDLSRYPSHFVRLKQEQWEKLKRHMIAEETITVEQRAANRFNSSFFSRFFRKNKEPVLEPQPIDLELQPKEERELDFEPVFVYQPGDASELKKLYLEQLFHSQLKWASSTVFDKSNFNARFYHDTLLRQLMLQLPDNYLLLYYPILLLKKAPVELDIILLGPTACYCISVLEEEDDAVFTGGSEKFWLRKIRLEETKTLSPLIGLNRMESVVKGLFHQEKIDMPIRKIILSRNGYLDVPVPLYDVELIDKRRAGTWFTQLASVRSPFKREQFRAAELLLKMSETTSYRKLDFEEEGTL